MKWIRGQFFILGNIGFGNFWVVIFRIQLRCELGTRVFGRVIFEDILKFVRISCVFRVVLLFLENSVQVFVFFGFSFQVKFIYVVRLGLFGGFLVEILGGFRGAFSFVVCRFVFLFGEVFVFFGVCYSEFFFSFFF